MCQGSKTARDVGAAGLVGPGASRVAKLGKQNRDCVVGAVSSR